MSSTPSPTPDQAPVATLEYEHSALEQFMVAHSRKLLLVGGVALAGTLLYLGSRMLSDYKESKSRIAFFQAKDVGELLKVASEHEGQPAAGTAMLDAARRLEQEKRTAEAIDLLQKFVVKYSEEGHPLLDFARFRLGDMLAAAGRAAEATPLYNKIVEGNGAFAPRAELRLADALVTTGDKDGAKIRYEKLQNLPNADAQIKAEAKERLELLKQTKPTVIPYVEPPKPETPKEPTADDLKITPPTEGAGAFDGIGISSPDSSPPAGNTTPAATPPAGETPPAAETPAATPPTEAPAGENKQP